ncbi:hypothetical protein GOP47_0019466 [Adiantum capillus-veneris]|uniref:mitogen-activated protein kinase kinase kinase n=1 Tax=Adiantum capillus-veneris TaxID=13818 RepID=A0A9D4UCV1_ADICA|nr:hypothetical protein GOP47_0019466 [Adiantum capillus-veneris]
MMQQPEERATAHPFSETREQSNDVVLAFNRSKVMQLLGAATPSDRHQIDELLNAPFYLSSPLLRTCMNIRAKHAMRHWKLKVFPFPSLGIMSRAWESTSWLTKSLCFFAPQDPARMEDTYDGERHLSLSLSTIQNHGKHLLPKSNECASTDIMQKAHPLPLPPTLPRRPPSVDQSPGGTMGLAFMHSPLCKPTIQQTKPPESLALMPAKVHGKLPDMVPSAETPMNSCSSSLSFPVLSPCSPLAKAQCPQNWITGAVLGRGTFGVVHEGLNLEDGSFFAVKKGSTEDAFPEIQHEINVLSKLEHPNIVRYLGSSVKDGRLCIFLELMRMGSLETLLQKYKRLEDSTVRGYTRQILLGLSYLHEKKTIHRDIKCANILVDVNGQVKLSDFGVAKKMGDSLFSSLKGTPLYMAPEVLTPNGKSYSFSADIWSLGCTDLEMADGKPPWSDLEGFGFLFKVKDGELPPLPDHLSPEGKDFVCSCLKLVASDRPTAAELLQNPFVTNASSPKQVVLSSRLAPDNVFPTMEASLFPSFRSWQFGDEHESWKSS